MTTYYTTIIIYTTTKVFTTVTGFPPESTTQSTFATAGPTLSGQLTFQPQPTSPIASSSGAAVLARDVDVLAKSKCSCPSTLTKTKVKTIHTKATSTSTIAKINKEVGPRATTTAVSTKIISATGTGIAYELIYSTIYVDPRTATSSTSYVPSNPTTANPVLMPSATASTLHASSSSGSVPSLTSSSTSSSVSLRPTPKPYYRFRIRQLFWHTSIKLSDRSSR